MKRTRLIVFVLSLAQVGAQWIAAAAQPVQPTAVEPAAVRPTAVEPVAVAPAPPASSGADRYDVGAAAANVLWVPIKIATCGLTAATGVIVFGITLGAASNWTRSAFEEGCAQKWLLTGDDFRPVPRYATAGQ